MDEIVCNVDLVFNIATNTPLNNPISNAKDAPNIPHPLVKG